MKTMSWLRNKQNFLKKSWPVFWRSPRYAFEEMMPLIRPNRKLKFPRLIQLHLTELCNFKCPGCHIQDCRDDVIEQSGSNFLDMSLIKKVLAEAKDYHPAIYLFGGEPTLHPKIGEIIRLVSENGLISTMTTNGYLVPKYAEAFVQNGLNFLTMNLEGWDEESSYRRGFVKGSHARILESLSTLKKLKGNQPFPIVKIVTLITRSNYANLLDIGRLLLDLGVERWALGDHFFVTDTVMEETAAFYRRTGFGEYAMGAKVGSSRFFEPDEVKVLKDNLQRIREEIEPHMAIEYNFNRDLEVFYSLIPPGKHSSCMAPYNTIEVMMNGDIAICQGACSIGNLNSTSIKDIWQGDRRKSFLEDHLEPNDGPLPMCYRCCALDFKWTEEEIRAYGESHDK